MPDRIYQKKEKNIPGWGYWGDADEIEVGISSGSITSENFITDALHYHKEGIVFILATEGEGKIEVNGTVYVLKKDEVLRITPGEKYRHLEATITPFSWITLCTVKDLGDKVGDN